MRFAFSKLNQNFPLACETIGYNWSQHKVYRPTGYSFFHWLQTEKGNGYIEIESQTIKLSVNQGILIPPNVPHSYYPDSSNSEWITSFLTFYGRATPILSEFIEIKNFIYFSDLSEKLAAFIKNNFSIFLNDDLEYLYNQSSLIYNFFMLIKKNYSKLNYIPKNDPVIDAIITYFENEYSRSITNQSIADYTGYSISYQNEIFRNTFGLTPLQYLTEYRLRKAKYLLVTRKDLQVQEIAELVGFPDASRFVHLFKNYNNLTPAKYRKTMNWELKIIILTSQIVFLWIFTCFQNLYF